MSELAIIPFSSDLKSEFEMINKTWVEEYFTLEPFDVAQLENPEKTIIEAGGDIVFAKMGDEIVGTVGLAKVEDGVFEMVKMGVKKSAQGHGVGMFLGKAILEKAKEMGGTKMVLYSSTKLQPALHIYKKLGFVESVPEAGKYCRCDVKMVLDLV
ncbi:GNAT family N-acetyltransferase [Algoriphagus machipongonensis]|uniref:Transcriptional regulator, MarR family/acetyltransferase, GNAT family protein n=1 Tax=Algoriphagus machipongonensis TaxID=388413 RepID=A3I149_9BACT|nr:GNAT family N-acetyltransferase [Algoriphagus machipongonensis]EAZ80195.1 transcriptional regulator, MarR family/acetyltransferase, GNAT family protein [Algoriphagus machipongonensis]